MPNEELTPAQIRYMAKKAAEEFRKEQSAKSANPVAEDAVAADLPGEAMPTTVTDLTVKPEPKRTEELRYFPLENLKAIGSFLSGPSMVTPPPQATPERVAKAKAEEAAYEQENKDIRRRQSEMDRLVKRTGVIPSLMPGYTNELPDTDTGSMFDPILAPESRRKLRDMRMQSKKDIDENHPIVNALVDAGTVVAGLPVLVANVTGPAFVPKDAPEEKQREVYRDKKEEFLEGAAEGMVLGTAQMLEHPVDELQAHPVATVATAVPAVRGVAKLTKAAGRVASQADIGKTWAKSASKDAKAGLHVVPDTPVTPPSGKFQGVYEGALKLGDKAKGGLNAIQDAVARVDAILRKKGWPDDLRVTTTRILSDGLATDSPQASALLEKIALDPDAVASEVESIGKRIAARDVDSGTAPRIVREDLGGAEGVNPVTRARQEHAAAQAEYNRITELAGQHLSALKRQAGEGYAPPVELASELSDATQTLKDARRNLSDIQAQVSKYREGVAKRLGTTPDKVQPSPEVTRALEVAASKVMDAEARLKAANDSVRTNKAEYIAEAKKTTVIRPPAAAAMRLAKEKLDRANAKLAEAEADPMVGQAELRGSLTKDPFEYTQDIAAAKTNAPLSRRRAIEDMQTANPALRADIQRVAELIGKADTPELVADRLLQIMDDESATLLAEPKIREQVLRELVRNARERTPTKVPEADLRARIGEMLDDAAKRGIDLDVGNYGDFINVPQTIRAVVSKNITPAGRAHALRVVAQQLAEEARTERFKSALDTERNRFGVPEKYRNRQAEENVNKAYQMGAEDHFIDQERYAPGTATSSKFNTGYVAYADDVVAAVTQSNDSLPIVIPKELNPKQIAAAMRGNPDKYSKRWQELGYTLEGVRGEHHEPLTPAQMRRVHAVADQIDGYVELDPNLIPGGGWSDPLYKQSLEWHEKSRRGIDDPVLRSITGGLKANLTARNPVADINNKGANLGRAMVSLGRDPVSLVAEGIKHGIDLIRHKNGKMPDGPDKRFYDALERTGVIDTDTVKADIGDYHRSVGNLPVLKQLYEGVTVPIPKVGKVKVGLEPNYRVGDALPKLVEGKANWAETNQYIDWLKDGDSITIHPSPRYSVELIKDGDSVILRSDNLPSLSGKRWKIGSKELDTLIAKEAVAPAVAWTFNYADTSLLAKWLKQAPIVGVKSPFYTYTSKAIDIPFIKKGQAARLFWDDPHPVESNNARVLADQGVKRIGLAARRAMIVNGLRNDVDGESDNELGRAFRFLPHEDKAQVVSMLGDPNYVASAGFGSWNYVSASMKLFRMLAQGYAETQRPEGGLSKLYDVSVDKQGFRNVAVPKTGEQARLQQLLMLADSQGLSSFSDVLDIIGLAGDPIKDTVDMISKSADAGEVVRLDDAFRTLASAVLGAVPVKAMDVGFGVATQDRELDPAPWTSRMRAVYDDPQLTIPIQFWAVQKFSGLGWQVKKIRDLGPKQQYSVFNKMKREWESTYNIQKRIAEGRKIRKIAQQSGDRAKEAEAEAYLAAARLDKAIIRKALQVQWKNYKDVAEQAYKMKLPDELDSDDVDRESGAEQDLVNQAVPD